MKTENIFTLNKAKIGHKYTIVNIDKNENNQIIRMYDLGFIKNSTITPLFDSMFGGCTSYFVKGCVIALREKDAKKIIVRETL